MFENISFLFLFSLAFSTWVVLCYLHIVDEQKRFYDYRVELYTENPGVITVPESSQKITIEGGSTKSYDLIISFVFIFGGTLMLSNLLQWLELQLHKFIQPQSMSVAAVPPNDTFAIINEVHMGALDGSLLNGKDGPSYQYQEANFEIKSQLKSLEVRCLEMQQLLQNIRSNTCIDSRSTSEQNICSSGSGFRPIPAGDVESEGDSESYSCTSNDYFNINFETDSARTMIINESTSTLSLPAFMSLTPEFSPKHNIFINNSHIHINLNGNVNFSENSVNIDMRQQGLLYTRKQSEFLQVWSKFIAAPTERIMLPGVRANELTL